MLLEVISEDVNIIIRN